MCDWMNDTTLDIDPSSVSTRLPGAVSVRITWPAPAPGPMHLPFGSMQYSDVAAVHQAVEVMVSSSSCIRVMSAASSLEKLTVMISGDVRSAPPRYWTVGVSAHGGNGET